MDRQASSMARWSWEMDSFNLNNCASASRVSQLITFFFFLVCRLFVVFMNIWCIFTLDCVCLKTMKHFFMTIVASSLVLTGQSQLHNGSVELVESEKLCSKMWTDLFSYAHSMRDDDDDIQNGLHNFHILPIAAASPASLLLGLDVEIRRVRRHDEKKREIYSAQAEIVTRTNALRVTSIFQWESLPNMNIKYRT